MNNTALIFLGAGLGGVFRYWISNAVHFFLDKQFPYGTFVVNVSGCFLMGLLFVLTVERISSFSTPLRAFLLIGFLGGYTTFSSFSIETINLFENGYAFNAIFNMLLSTVICVLAAWLGVVGGRSL